MHYCQLQLLTIIKCCHSLQYVPLFLLYWFEVFELFVYLTWHLLFIIDLLVLDFISVYKIMVNDFYDLCLFKKRYEIFRLFSYGSKFNLLYLNKNCSLSWLKSLDIWIDFKHLIGFYFVIKIWSFNLNCNINAIFYFVLKISLLCCIIFKFRAYLVKICILIFIYSIF